MGYEYLAIKGNTATAYHTDNKINGKRFYFIDPRNHSTQMFGYDTTIDTTEASGYPQAQKDFYNQYMVWKSNDTFPNNLATGWFFGTSSVYALMWDFQQQAVIDMVVEGFVNMAKSYESSSLNFKFAGWMDDEPNLNGYFYTWDATNTVNVVRSIGYWTGTSSGLLHGTITHEYKSYADGKAAFYKRLRQRCREEFAETRWLVEPYNVYAGWVQQIGSRTDKLELVPDLISQESAGTEFIDDSRIYTAGQNITTAMMGTSQPNEPAESLNRLYAAKAGINGAWYNWFGRYGGTGNMPAFKYIYEVYPRLKLIRCIPNWDNLNNIPLADRSWDGNVYQSVKNSGIWTHADEYIYYSRHWKRPGEIFVCVQGTNSPQLGTVTIRNGEFVKKIWRTNGYYEAETRGEDDWNRLNNNLWLKENVLVGTQTSVGRGYIFEVRPHGIYNSNLNGTGTVKGDGTVQIK